MTLLDNILALDPSTASKHELQAFLRRHKFHHDGTWSVVTARVCALKFIASVDDATLFNTIVSCSPDDSLDEQSCETIQNLLPDDVKCALGLDRSPNAVAFVATLMRRLRPQMFGQAPIMRNIMLTTLQLLMGVDLCQRVIEECGSDEFLGADIVNHMSRLLFDRVSLTLGFSMTMRADKKRVVLRNIIDQVHLALRTNNLVHDLPPVTDIDATITSTQQTAFLTRYAEFVKYSFVSPDEAERIKRIEGRVPQITARVKAAIKAAAEVREIRKDANLPNSLEITPKVVLELFVARALTPTPSTSVVRVIDPTLIAVHRRPIPGTNDIIVEVGIFADVPCSVVPDLNGAGALILQRVLNGQHDIAMLFLKADIKTILLDVSIAHDQLLGDRNIPVRYDIFHESCFIDQARPDNPIALRDSPLTLLPGARKICYMPDSPGDSRRPFMRLGLLYLKGPRQGIDPAVANTCDSIREGLLTLHHLQESADTLVNAADFVLQHARNAAGRALDIAHTGLFRELATHVSVPLMKLRPMRPLLTEFLGQLREQLDRAIGDTTTLRNLLVHSGNDGTPQSAILLADPADNNLSFIMNTIDSVEEPLSLGTAKCTVTAQNFDALLAHMRQRAQDVALFVFFVYIEADLSNTQFDALIETIRSAPNLRLITVNNPAVSRLIRNARGVADLIMRDPNIPAIAAASEVVSAAAGFTAFANIIWMSANFTPNRAFQELRKSQTMLETHAQKRQTKWIATIREALDRSNNRVGRGALAIVCTQNVAVVSHMLAASGFRSAVFDFSSALNRRQLQLIVANAAVRGIIDSALTSDDKCVTVLHSDSFVSYEKAQLVDICARNGIRLVLVQQRVYPTDVKLNGNDEIIHASVDAPAATAWLADYLLSLPFAGRHHSNEVEELLSRNPDRTSLIAALHAPITLVSALCLVGVATYDVLAEDPILVALLQANPQTLANHLFEYGASECSSISVEAFIRAVQAQNIDNVNDPSILSQVNLVAAIVAMGASAAVPLLTFRDFWAVYPAAQFSNQSSRAADYLTYVWNLTSTAPLETSLLPRLPEGNRLSPCLLTILEMGEGNGAGVGLNAGNGPYYLEPSFDSTFTVDEFIMQELVNGGELPARLISSAPEFPVSLDRLLEALAITAHPLKLISLIPVPHLFELLANLSPEQIHNSNFLRLAEQLNHPLIKDANLVDSHLQDHLALLRLCIETNEIAPHLPEHLRCALVLTPVDLRLLLERNIRLRDFDVIAQSVLSVVVGLDNHTGSSGEKVNMLLKQPHFVDRFSQGSNLLSLLPGPSAKPDVLGSAFVDFLMCVVSSGTNISALDKRVIAHPFIGFLAWLSRPSASTSELGARLDKIASSSDDNAISTLAQALTQSRTLSSTSPRETLFSGSFWTCFASLSADALARLLQQCCKLAHIHALSALVSLSHEYWLAHVSSSGSNKAVTQRLVNMFTLVQPGAPLDFEFANKFLSTPAGKTVLALLPLNLNKYAVPTIGRVVCVLREHSFRSFLEPNAGYAPVERMSLLGIELLNKYADASKGVDRVRISIVADQLASILSPSSGFQAVLDALPRDQRLCTGTHRTLALILWCRRPLWELDPSESDLCNLFMLRSMPSIDFVTCVRHQVTTANSLALLLGAQHTLSHALKLSLADRYRLTPDQRERIGLSSETDRKLFCIHKPQTYSRNDFDREIAFVWNIFPADALQTIKDDISGWPVPDEEALFRPRGMVEDLLVPFSVTSCVDRQTIRTNLIALKHLHKSIHPLNADLQYAVTHSRFSGSYFALDEPTKYACAHPDVAEAKCIVQRKTGGILPGVLIPEYAFRNAQQRCTFYKYTVYVVPNDAAIVGQDDQCNALAERVLEHLETFLPPEHMPDPTPEGIRVEDFAQEAIHKPVVVVETLPDDPPSQVPDNPNGSCVSTGRVTFGLIVMWFISFGITIDVLAGWLKVPESEIEDQLEHVSDQLQLDGERLLPTQLVNHLVQHSPLRFGGDRSVDEILYTLARLRAICPSPDIANEISNDCLDPATDEYQHAALKIASSIGKGIVDVLLECYEARKPAEVTMSLDGEPPRTVNVVQEWMSKLAQDENDPRAAQPGYMYNLDAPRAYIKEFTTLFVFLLYADKTPTLPGSPQGLDFLRSFLEAFKAEVHSRFPSELYGKTVTHEQLFADEARMRCETLSAALFHVMASVLMLDDMLPYLSLRKVFIELNLSRFPLIELNAEQVSEFWKNALSGTLLSDDCIVHLSGGSMTFATARSMAHAIDLSDGFYDPYVHQFIVPCLSDPTVTPKLTKAEILKLNEEAKKRRVENMRTQAPTVPPARAAAGNAANPPHLANGNVPAWSPLRQRNAGEAPARLDNAAGGIFTWPTQMAMANTMDAISVVDARSMIRVDPWHLYTTIQLKPLANVVLEKVHSADAYGNNQIVAYHKLSAASRPNLNSSKILRNFVSSEMCWLFFCEKAHEGLVLVCDGVVLVKGSKVWEVHVVRVPVDWALDTFSDKSSDMITTLFAGYDAGTSALNDGGLGPICCEENTHQTHDRSHCCLTHLLKGMNLSRNHFTDNICGVLVTIACDERAAPLTSNLRQAVIDWLEDPCDNNYGRIKRLREHHGPARWNKLEECLSRVNSPIVLDLLRGVYQDHPLLSGEFAKGMAKLHNDFFRANTRAVAEYWHDQRSVTRALSLNAISGSDQRRLPRLHWEMLKPSKWSLRYSSTHGQPIGVLLGAVARVFGEAMIHVAPQVQLGAHDLVDGQEAAHDDPIVADEEPNANARRPTNVFNIIPDEDDNFLFTEAAAAAAAADEAAQQNVGPASVSESSNSANAEQEIEEVFIKMILSPLPKHLKYQVLECAMRILASDTGESLTTNAFEGTPEQSLIIASFAQALGAYWRRGGESVMRAKDALVDACCLSPDLQAISTRAGHWFGVHLVDRVLNVLGALERHGVQYEIINGAHISTPAALFQKLQDAIDRGVCFVYVMEAKLSNPDLSLKWCCERTKRQPWVTIIFEGLQTPFRAPELNERLIVHSVRPFGMHQGSSSPLQQASGLERWTVQQLCDVRPVETKYLVTHTWREESLRLLTIQVHQVKVRLFIGPPGVGKSVAVQDFERNRRFFTQVLDGSSEDLVQMAPQDLLRPPRDHERALPQVLILDECHYVDRAALVRICKLVRDQSMFLLMVGNRYDQTMLDIIQEHVVGDEDRCAVLMCQGDLESIVERLREHQGDSAHVYLHVLVVVLRSLLGENTLSWRFLDELIRTIGSGGVLDLETNKNALVHEIHRKFQSTSHEFIRDLVDAVYHVVHKILQNFAGDIKRYAASYVGRLCPQNQPVSQLPPSLLLVNAALNDMHNPGRSMTFNELLWSTSNELLPNGDLMHRLNPPSKIAIYLVYMCRFGAAHIEGDRDNVIDETLLHEQVSECLASFSRFSYIEVPHQFPYMMPTGTKPSRHEIEGLAYLDRVHTYQLVSDTVSARDLHTLRLKVIYGLALDDEGLRSKWKEDPVTDHSAFEQLVREYPRALSLVTPRNLVMLLDATHSPDFCAAVMKRFHSQPNFRDRDDLFFTAAWHFYCFKGVLLTDENVKRACRRSAGLFDGDLLKLDQSALVSLRKNNKTFKLEAYAPYGNLALDEFFVWAASHAPMTLRLARNANAPLQDLSQTLARDVWATAERLVMCGDARRRDTMLPMLFSNNFAGYALLKEQSQRDLDTNSGLSWSAALVLTCSETVIGASANDWAPTVQTLRRLFTGCATVSELNALGSFDLLIPALMTFSTETIHRFVSSLIATCMTHLSEEWQLKLVQTALMDFPHAAGDEFILKLFQPALERSISAAGLPLLMMPAPMDGVADNSFFRTKLIEKRKAMAPAFQPCDEEQRWTCDKLDEELKGVADLARLVLEYVEKSDSVQHLEAVVQRLGDSTVAEQAPSTDAEQAPSTDAEQAPSTDAEQAPSTVAEQALVRLSCERQLHWDAPTSASEMLREVVNSKRARLASTTE